MRGVLVPQAVELVMFTVRPGEEEEFVAERPAMLAAMRSRFTGLEHAYLARRDDGSWLDIVIWTSREEAEAAAAGMGMSPRRPDGARTSSRSSTWTTPRFRSRVQVDADVPQAVLERARDGDSAAVEAVLRAVQDLVYSIALRTIWHRQDAQDAAQEALIAVARGLPAFRGDSRLSTWVTTIAVREATRARDRAALMPVPAEHLLVDEAHPGPGSDHRLLQAELDLACASGLVTLLSVPVRAAYVLADVLELHDSTGAQVLGIAAATYRQRVSRARRTLRADLDIRLGPVPADVEDARVARAAAELSLLAATRPPVDLSTPDFVSRLRTVAPELLTGLPQSAGAATGGSQPSTDRG